MFCFAPNKWNGSKIIYEKIIRPVFLNYETEIDNTLGTVEEVANQAAKLVSDLQPKLIAAGNRKSFYKSLRCGYIILSITPTITLTAETKLKETVNEQFY